MKKIFTCLLLIIGLQSFAQNLIITEISYNGPEAGTDSTEFIELYNNTSSSIDLSGYAFTSGIIHTFYPGETIAAGAYYVIAVDSLAIFNTFGYLADSQWMSGGLANGGESIALKDASGVLQDTVRYDDNTPWSYQADGYGTTLVFCDFTLDNNDGANWFASTTDAGIIVNATSVYGSPGAADAACSAPIALDTMATITTADMSVLENVGTVDVTVTLNQAPTLDKTIDLVLNIGNAAVVNSYTTQTITFTGGSTSETVTITVTPGQLASTSETLEFGLDNVGTGLEFGADTLFNLTVNEMPPAATPCSDLYFSEYIKGSSQNKALEIYNPTTGIIDLTNYEIRKYANGTTTPSSVSLSGSLLPGEVFVVSHSSADAAILAEADFTTGFFDFNGNDALELYDATNMVSVDIIGEIGVNPGATWTVGTGSTAGFTLVRMATIDAGTTSWIGFGDQQWDVNPNNDFSFIGSHTNTSCSAAIPLTAYPVASAMEVCLGDTIWFSHTSFGGTAPYTAGWEINAVQTVGDVLEYETTTAGIITVSFGVADGSLATDDSVFTIKVNALPSTGVTFDNSTVCAMDTANFVSTATGVSTILTYNYALSPSGELSDSLNGNGFIVPDTDGVFTITQMVTDSLGCMASQDFDVISNVLDDATFGALANICEDASITLTHTNTTGVWSGSIVTDLGNGTGTATGTAGNYDVTYTTTGACPDVHTESVELYATPTASFTNAGSISVEFTNTSTGGTTCSWDLGDGSTSTQCDPMHTYASDGTYSVCLTTTSADGCTDTACETITIQGVGVSEIGTTSFNMFPNPTNGLVTINTTANATLQLINIVGEVVWTSNVVKTADLDFSNLSKGSYFVKVNVDGKIETKKLIIQ